MRQQVLLLPVVGWRWLSLGRLCNSSIFLQNAGFTYGFLGTLLSRSRGGGALRGAVGTGSSMMPFVMVGSTGVESCLLWGEVMLGRGPKEGAVESASSTP